jgi:prevent-host-death family protein
MSKPTQGQGAVLLVEHDRSVLRANAQHLELSGFSVSKATSTEDAVVQLDEGSFDLVVVDIALPHVDGFVLLDNVRRRDPDLPVVLVLEGRSETSFIGAKEGGPLQFVAKPIDATALTRSVARAIGFHRRVASVRSGAQVSFRNRFGAQTTPRTVAATEAKNEFGEMLETTLRDGAVVITKHDKPKVVFLSIEEFDALTQARQRKLDVPRAEFDALLAQMQTPRAKAGMRTAFGADPSRLAKAAVAAAKKHG